ncbi:MAG: hypothetical protein V7637_2224 [Mycobacteriales bacterium]|jgi:AcrR family transcriptional regulator
MGEPRRPVWDRPQRDARPAPVPLTRGGIVAAAVGIADRDGLPAVSLRRVAAELGSGPMRIYRHVDAKHDLLDLMVDAAYGEIDIGPPPEGWRAGLTAIAASLQAVAVRHPWLAGLLAGHPPYGPNGLRLTEHALSAFAGLDVPATTVTRAVSTVIAYVIGYVQLELSPTAPGPPAEPAAGSPAAARSGPGGRPGPASGDSRSVGSGPQQPGNPGADYLARVAAGGAYPTLARVFTEIGQPDPRAEFAAGLGIVLDGIAALIG